MSQPDCYECERLSEEEQYSAKYDTYVPRIYCAAIERDLDLDEGEPCPEWCPRLRENQEKSENSI